MRRARILFAACALLLAAQGPVRAVQPDEMLSDPALEQRARLLSRELRCMVCQNQSIDDSNAPLAKDLRVLVRERIKAGDDDRAVLDYLVARYGEFVLMRPSWHGANVILWTAPFLVLVGGGLVVWIFTRRRRVATAPNELSPEEEKRLGELMGEPDQRITKV